jgi:hypothetical protein
MAHMSATMNSAAPTIHRILVLLTLQWSPLFGIGTTLHGSVR